MIKEFKEFLMRGNVLDLAVAVIIGTAFGAVINSLVKDVIMPPIGLILGKVNFTNLFIDISGQNFKSLTDAQAAGAATINYGLFINTIINFLIVGFVIFLIIKAANKAKKPAPVAAPDKKDCPYCYSSIPIKATRCPHCTSELTN
jgi:large conductance mechanosensitive channel